MSNILQSEETLLREFQLDPNPLYEYPADKKVRILSTCPTNTQIKVHNAPISSSGSYTFDFNVGEKQFLSNVFQICYRIPFLVYLNTAADVAITKDNFIEKVFDNNDDICLAQHGLTQGERSVELSLNDDTISIVNNIDLLSNIVSPYYQADDVDEYFQASQPDRFQSFQQYSAKKDMQFDYLDGEGRTISTTINPINEQNIFSSTYQLGYSTRTPQWEFAEPIGVGDKEGAKVFCKFWSYVKFSVCATPNNEETISGVRRVFLATRLNDDIAPYVFNLKQADDGSYRYKLITQDLSDVNNTRATLYTKIITPPKYMLDTQSTSDGKLKPYTIGYPLITPKLFDSIPAQPGQLTSFNQGAIQLDSIPRSMYLALVKEKKGDWLTKSSTPINYGLISNLTVVVNEAITSFPDERSIDYVTKSNGYDELDPIGKLVKGYPIKLNFGKDISLTNDLVVGESAILNMSVNGNFYNQGNSNSTYRLVVVIVSDGTIDYADGHFTKTLGVRIPTNLMNEKYFLTTLFSRQQKQLEVIGGGRFGDALKWFGRNAVKLAKNAWQNRDAIASTIGDVVSLAKTIKGGKVAYSNVSGSGNGTVTLGAGTVKSSIFK